MSDAHTGPPIAYPESQSGLYTVSKTLWGSSRCEVIQHAGTKLSGYASSATTTMVAQNATPVFCGRRSLCPSLFGEQSVRQSGSGDSNIFFAWSVADAHAGEFVVDGRY